MRFEPLEPRIVLDAALGPSQAFQIHSGAHAPAAIVADVPTDIQIQAPDDSFRYASDHIDPDVLDRLIAEASSWNTGEAATFPLENNNTWHKLESHNAVSFHQDGYIVAKRTQGQSDSRSMIVPSRIHEQCPVDGIYTRQDHHYFYSFDVRIPTTESSWLTGTDDHQAIITELSGPHDNNDVLFDSPFAIYTSVQDGVPYWTIRTTGDWRATTTGNPYFEDSVSIPLHDLGQWHSWDVEYVPNSFRTGIARAWLNGQLVAEWVKIPNAYTSLDGGAERGPLNPAFGIHSDDAADGLEAHFDNISFRCNGAYQSSLSGVVTGGAGDNGYFVYATNLADGQKYGTYTSDSGVYSLELPKGDYSLAAVDASSGRIAYVHRVSTRFITSEHVHLNLSINAATYRGDVDGDGQVEVLNRLADGEWLVTSFDEFPDGRFHNQSYFWGSWSTSVGWSNILVADFTGDGRDDVAGRAETGHWWVSVSTGGSFDNQYWGHWSADVDWNDVGHGDFNGDGRSDIIGRAASSGDWWVATSNGSRFDNNLWARWSAAVDWEVVYGDYNGDGQTDIAGRSGNSLWVSASIGTRFETKYWGHFADIGWSALQVGDFNGDGLSDIAAMAERDGSWWVAQSTGTRFVNQRWGRWSSYVDWWDLAVADVDGDGRSDIVGRASSSGVWWIAHAHATQFTNQRWGTSWPTNGKWHSAMIDDFDGDGKPDLLGIAGDEWMLNR